MTNRIIRLGETGAGVEVAGVIRDARRLVGWSQADLAGRAGVSQSALSQLADNRDVVTRAFPERIGDVAAWLADPSRPAPRGWAIGTADPASRERAWLRSTMIGSRRRPPAYRDDADAAARLLRR